MHAVESDYLVVGLSEDLHSFLLVLEALLPHFFTGATQAFNMTGIPWYGGLKVNAD